MVAWELLDRLTQKPWQLGLDQTLTREYTTGKNVTPSDLLVVFLSIEKQKKRSGVILLGPVFGWHVLSSQSWLMIWKGVHSFNLDE